MKIEGKVTLPLAGEPAVNTKPTRTGNTRVGDLPAAESADVQVSALATQLRQIGTQLGAGDMVDAVKVADIRRAIAQGQLQIDPEAIADRLLEVAAELIRENPGTKP